MTREGAHRSRVRWPLLAGIPERSRLWWVLQPLQDQAALPLLRYWENAGSDPERRKEARNVVVALESRQDSSARRGADCCQPTRACLVQRVHATAGSMGAAIATAEQAQAWLEGQTAVPAELEIRFLDSLERVADVKTSATRMQRWEHLYGCWRSTGAGATP